MKIKILALSGLAVVFAIAAFVQQREIVKLQGELASARGGKNAASAGHVGAMTPADARTVLGGILAGKTRADRTRGLIAFADSLDAAGTRAALDDLAKQPLTGKNFEALNILVDRLVTLDPAGAFNWANAVPSANGKSLMLDLVFSAWASADAGKALAALGDVANPALRERLTGTVLSSMITTDPQAAIEALRNLPGDARSRATYQSVFSAWGSADPAAAAAAVANLPPTRDRNFAMLGVANGWAVTDPKAALEWINKLPPGNEARNQAETSALMFLSQQDPQAAMDYVANITTPTTRNQYIQMLASELGADDPQSALAWVQQAATGQARDYAVMSLLGVMSQTDPQAAIAHLDDLPASLRDSTINSIASNWAGLDVKADLDWLRGMPNSTLTKSVIGNTLNDWASNNPEDALAYVAANIPHNDPLFTSFTSTVISNRFAADPATAMAWAESQAADDWRAQARRVVITQMGGVDPQQAWTLALQLPPNEQSSVNTAANVMGKWAAQDPAQAAAAIATLPEGELLVRVTGNIAGAWVRHDPLAASQWISTLPAGSARDAAVTQLISVEGRNDLPTAFNWALSVSDTSARAQQLDGVVQQWAKKDPAAAASAVQDANLTEQQRAALNAAIQKAAPK